MATLAGGTAIGQETTPLSTLHSQRSGGREADLQVVETKSGHIFAPPTSLSQEPISISASYGWKGGDDGDEEIYVLYGDCRIAQGTDYASGPRAVLWIKNRETTENIACRQAVLYLEKENRQTPLMIEINSVFTQAQTGDTTWLGTFETLGMINLHLAQPGSNQLDPEAIYYRAKQMRDTGSNPALQTRLIPQTSQLTDGLGSLKGMGDKIGFRRFRIMPRYDTPSSISFETDPNMPNKKRAIINSGITIVIEGVSNDGKTISDVVDISADQAVIWVDGVDSLDSRNESLQANEYDLEIFVTGDIIFREGDRIIYAKQMYYDAKNRLGLIRDTEVIIPLPSNPSGFFRIKAEEVTQHGPNALTAKNSWFTTSMMGNPSYRLQAERITAESKTTSLFDAQTGQPLIDPETGKQMTKKDQYIIAENNVVALESVPVLYWPWMAMDARDQSLYIRNLNIGNDSIFGFRAETTWNPYQIFNCKNRPEGTDWDLNLDYLSKRGFGHGTTFLYNRESLFGSNGATVGAISYYGIYDSGKDNLGEGRRELTFPNPYRYRGVLKHRQMLNIGSSGCCSGWMLTGQFGAVSDRNYLAQYFENEWFTAPNELTSVELKKTEDNASLSLMAGYRLNDFVTQSSWLPRVDHYWLGKPLFTNKLLWYEHTKLGYAQFRTANTPYDPNDALLFRYLDWELANSSQSNIPDDDDTVRLSTDSFNFSSRHELDIPLELGPFKVVPYGLGEYGFWGQGNEEQSINRLYGRGGVRFDLPLWKIYPDVNSQTWYVNGLAHKTNLTLDASYSSVNHHYQSLPLYDAPDDWQVEDFRRRYSMTTFGGEIPVQFDERYYAIRQGALGGAVTSPVTELADDLTLLRFQWDNRWQTKRGSIGKRHTIDWITFNMGANFYPEKEQNFNQYVGLADYDFRWHVGDRFSVLSSGLYDFFNQGQTITRLGVSSKRPDVASLYVGVDRLAGPIDSTYLNASVNYRMSQKWGISAGASYDISAGTNVGQSASISRVGESFIFTLGGNYNASKNNWGLNLSVIPVFLLDRKKKEDAILNYSAL